MRVLMLGWEFPPSITGGLGTACYGLTKSLSAIDNIEIIFVAPKLDSVFASKHLKLIGANKVKLDSKKTDYKKLLEKIMITEIESNLIPYSSPKEYEKIIQQEIHSSQKKPISSKIGEFAEFTGDYSGNLFQEAANYAIVANQLVKELEFDLIHVHDWLTFPAGLAIKKVTNKPLVVHIHATEYDRSGGNGHPEVYNIEQKGIENADRIIAVSNYTRKTILDNYSVSPEKVLTVYNAVEVFDQKPKLLKKKTKEKLVTFLGRITRQKGPEYFIEAAEKVLKKNKNVKFILAGGGELFSAMKQKVADMGLGNKIKFVGHLQQNQVVDLFQKSDLYVMSSVSEPFGITPLEAMLLEVPVILSNQSGISEIINNVLKYDYWDTDALSESILKVLSNKKLSDNLKIEGKKEAEKYKWDFAASQVKAIYDNLLSQ